ncbi:DinB family protein [Roseibium sediminicola]|uniref:DinB family protein n=1 Tax=Roseibium sediminicola TaxID=2933272 RepID=A0ABT0GSM7_9HYPH|nr:DinB family protein [Roseibium sp. CAU 1639]MCK7612438.1 DinB family protein [Roseibium sp. CAU 1639]
MHIDPVLYQRMAAYNAWMTEKAYAAAGQLSDAERKADRGAFFRSIHSTLNHLLFADRAWMRRFTGTPYEIKGMGVDLYEHFEVLKSAHLEMCADISAFADGLTPEWLAGTLEWKGVTHPAPRSRPRWLLVTHMFNHQTHHRGQLSTLLTQAGQDIGVTDLPFMPDLIVEHEG